MIKISVIIPVFNAERYLERCLDSVLEALEGVSGEILVVDNGSSDDSLKIAQKYQKSRPRASISVLSCPTPGAAAARNLGAKQAKGEYIWFVDADDYIDKTAANKLLTKADQTGADMVMLGAKRLLGDGTVSYLSAVEAGRRDTKSRFVRYGMGPWQVLIRRKWWSKNKFAFHEGIIHEDMELMSSLILCTDNFASIDEPLYFYCENPESVLHKSKFNSHIFDIFPALEGLYRKFEEAGAAKRYHDELEWFFIWNLLIDSAKDFGKFPEGKSGFSRSREMLKKYFPAWRKNRFLMQKPLKLRVRVRLNYHK
ncbi:MAG: glycosyltransferase family A protein [Candidatus Saccharibacteria bacterium]|nr:glycosyltransferase family A protein [Candidatus Saccharibacteria bacterium]